MQDDIFSNHAHVFQKQVREDGTIDALKRIMDSCRISRSVVFAPFSEYFDASEGNPNLWLEKQIKSSADFYGFGTVDFSKDDLVSQVDMIHSCGFKGIKVHPAFQKIRVDGEKAFTVYRRAEELGLSVSFHTGIHWHRIADYNMLLFDEVAYHFPNLKISLEHVGGYSFFSDAIAVMINNPRNVYAGLTSVFDREMNKYWFLSDSQALDLMWLTGDDRIIFGLDFPYNDEQKIKAAIDKIEQLYTDEHSKKKIFKENIEKFLGLN